jgi:hypothetical protein
LGIVDANRYLRVSAAWVVAVFGPSAAMFAYHFIGPDCDGGEFYGCRWGIDGVDGMGIAFALVVSMVTLGPLAVYLALRFSHDRLAGRTAGLTVAVAVPTLLLATLLPLGGLVLVAGAAVAGRMAAVRIWR